MFLINLETIINYNDICRNCVYMKKYINFSSNNLKGSK